MRTALEVIDYHKPIYKIGVVIAAHTDKAGDFVAETNEREEIKGHWEDVTYEMINRAPEGIYNAGDRMFYSGFDLQPLDKLVIVELEGEETRWEVIGRNQKLPFWHKLGVTRYSYHLKRIQNVDEFISPVIKAVEGTPKKADIPTKDPTPVIPTPPVVTPPVDNTPPKVSTWKPSWEKK